jgi:hypothetical protein
MPVSILRWQRRRRAGRRDRWGEVVLEDAVEIADTQRAEDENRRAHARLAQHHRFFDVGARQHRRPGGLEREPHLRRPVPISIRLDDGDDVGAG